MTNTIRLYVAMSLLIQGEVQTGARARARGLPEVCETPTGHGSSRSETRLRESVTLGGQLKSDGMGLTLHPEKTRLVDALVPGIGFDFLGYHFEAGTRWPHKKSLKKIKEALRHKTRRSNGHSLATIVVAP